MTDLEWLRAQGMTTWSRREDGKMRRFARNRTPDMDWTISVEADDPKDGWARLAAWARSLMAGKAGWS